jgi:hypothetical protein
MKYCIVPTNEVTQSMINDCTQTSTDSARKSLDGVSSILSYEGTKPSSLTGYTVLTRTQIDAVIDGGGWNPSFM